MARKTWVTEILLSSSILALALSAHATLPTGGQVVPNSGQGTINSSDSSLTVQQTSDKIALTWDTFSIGEGKKVTFEQPSSTSVALNQVLGSEVSVIQGSLEANGQIFLVNPQGILFSETAQVNTGGLIASTQSLSTEDFLAGNYTFNGTSDQAITNKGNLVTQGPVALIAAQIINQGTIESTNTLLGSGNKVVLDLGGPVKIEVLEGALTSLIDQGGAIRANGGKVYLTAKAAQDLTSQSTINHTGTIEAKTLSTGEKGEIVLLGDMQKGTLTVGGTLDASAPTQGDGGFVETSAATVDMKENLVVTTLSNSGKTGLWLIDPYDYVIGQTEAATIASALDSTNLTITTNTSNASYGAGPANTALGDITVDAPITYTGADPRILTLQAANNIILNKTISSTGGALTMLFDADIITTMCGMARG